MRNAGERPNHRSPDQRVVITGMGAITPVGNTACETWEALKAGRSGIGPTTVVDASAWPCQIAGQVKDFDPEQFIPRKKVRHMTAASQLAVVSAQQAVEDAGLDLDQEDRARVGVMIGTAAGNSVEEAEKLTMRLLDHDPGRLSPFLIVTLWPNMAAFYIAEALQVQGYNSTVCTACAGGTQAIGEAAEVIRRGDADIIFAGGTEYLAAKIALDGFTKIRALATSYNDEPERAMRPFDADREGFVPAQGSAILVLEGLHHARSRGARIYAEVLGHGTSNDAFHIIAPHPEGAGAALAMRQALASAAVSTDQVDYINAHGTSTPLGDASETKAIKAVFGARAYEVPISATKSMIGHMLGATGAVEAMACVMTIQEGILHPTINYETPDPECDLDYVPNEARKAKVDIAMSNSFGLGGQNAVLILGAYRS
jgi:3-oxoacyl-[acyl-carrier-protein] synthase II